MNAIPPIMIVGSPRSGTTFLQSLLNAHPHIAIPPEEYIVLKLFKKYGSLGKITTQEKRAFVNGLFLSSTFCFWNLKREHIEDTLESKEILSYQELIQETYMIYARSLDESKTRWGIKNPFYVNQMEKLYGIFPNTKFIHIIRDGRDVHLSKMNRIKKGAHKFRSGICANALEWNQHVIRGRKSGIRIGRNNCFVLKYEDLVADTEVVLKNICDYLGEDYTKVMIDNYYQNVLDKQTIRPKKMDLYILAAIDPSRVERWKEEMPDIKVSLYNAIAGSTLTTNGYEVSSKCSPVAFLIGTAVRLLGFLIRSLRRLRWCIPPVEDSVQHIQ